MDEAGMYQKILEERGVADNYLRDATIKDITVNSFKRGYNTRNLGEEIYKDITGQNNSYDYYDELLKGKDYNFQPGNWLEKTVSNASEFLGGQAHQWTDPDAVGAGLGAAGGAILAGQTGPQVVFPEEVISAPAAYLATNFAFQTKKAFEVEAGLAYREMLENGIDENIARNIALGVGGINGLLEAVQINDLVKSFKILDASDITKPFVKKLYNSIAKRFGNASAETVVEMAQEGVTMGGVNLGGKIDKGESVYGKDEINDRLKDTAESTFGSYMLLGGMGDSITNIYNSKMTVRDIYSNVIRNPYDAKALERVRNMTETERIYAQAGANAEDISVAAGRAAGHEYDGRKELEAYAYGLRQRKAGKGKDLELLIDATEFLDEFEDSGIMEREKVDAYVIADVENFDDYKVRVPGATETDYQLYTKIKNTGEIGIVRVPPAKIDKKALTLDTEHINERNHGVEITEAISFIEKAKYSIERKHWSGYTFVNYYSEFGAAYVRAEDNVIRTAFRYDEYKSKTKMIWEEILHE